MTGDTHYDLEILAELAEDLLDADTARRVREHLAVCDPCGELLADLAAVREVLAATPTPAMPMGVALRIDQALAAEASGRGGVGLAETPDWDELMRDSPWETEAPQPAAFDGAQSEGIREPVRLGAGDTPFGVVSDDGTIVPANSRTIRRRRWAVPAIAAAAAAVVVGTAVASTNLLADGSSGDTGSVVALPPQTQTPLAPLVSSPPDRNPVRAAKSYALTDSGHNYSDPELRMSLQSLLGPAPIIEGHFSNADKVSKCVSTVSRRAKHDVFAVDQGQYNGQDALIMASWKKQAAKKVRIDVVDPYYCKNLRKPALGRW